MRFIKEEIERKEATGTVKRYILDGDEIRAERMKKNLTLRAVSKSIGIPASYIRDVELNLKKSCNAEVYFKLLEFYSEKN